MAAQVALTIVLLAGSISVGRAFLKLVHADRGFDRGGLVTVNVSLEGTAFQADASRVGYFEEALDRIRRVPGVRSASSTEFLPLYATMFMGGTWSLDGQPARENSMVVPVFPDYFRTMGGRVLAGREFNQADMQNRSQLAVIDERLAGEFGPPAAALGRHLSLGRSTRLVVGIVKNMDYMTEGANSNEVFIPANSPGGFFSTIVARVNGPAERYLAKVRDASNRWTGRSRCSE
ncbi:MAG: ABC transporter permease [Ignavibacteriota bacterium]